MPPVMERLGERGSLVVALVLAAIQGVLLGRTAWDKSDTIDEPYYLNASVQQWLSRDFAGQCDAPALPKWGFAAALRLSDPDIFAPSDAPMARNPLESRPPAVSQRNLLAGRMVTILVTVGGGLFLALSAGRLGRLAAVVAQALWCFSPTLLANGSLATIDAWATSLAGLVLWATLRAWDRPTLPRTGLLAWALALAAASKVPALGLVPVAAAVVAWALVRDARSAGRRALPALLRSGAVLALVFFVTLWSLYLFDVGDIHTGGRICGKETGRPSHSYGPLPLAAWIDGVILQTLHGGRGHLTYALGEASPAGFWWFYLAALAFKTTIGAQLLALLALFAWWRTPKTRDRLLADGAILAYPVLLVAAMSAGRTQNGIRYILPAFPFAMFWAAREAQDLRRLFGRRGVGAVAAALLLGTIESLAVHPHHLMFFNTWAGGPVGGPRYFVHGDDWGQDQRRLGEWQRIHHPSRIFYTYYAGDPRRWGIRYQAPPCEPQPGLYALHAVEVHRPKRLPAGCLDWLTVEPPDERLGYSIYLYLVDDDRIERLARERGTITPFWQSGPPPGGAAVP